MRRTGIGVGVGVGLPASEAAGRGGRVPDILGDDAVAYYDAVVQGGNPQLLVWSDDPTQWSNTGVTPIELGKPDPEGGNNAFEMFGEAGKNNVTFHKLPRLASTFPVVLACKRVTPDAGGDGRDVTFGLRNETDGAWPGMNSEIISGPGTLFGVTTVRVDGLSTDEWTYIRVELQAPADPTKDTSLRIYPGISSNNVNDGSVLIYRPTIQFANHDGKLYKSTDTVPAIQTVLKDFSGNGYDQPCTTGPIYVADAGDGLPAWWCPSGSLPISDGVQFGASYDLPLYKWSCIEGSLVNGFIEHGGASGNEAALLSTTTAYANRINAAGLGTTFGDIIEGVFQWTKSKFDPAGSEGWLDGVQGSAGTATDIPLTGIRTGSNATGGTRYNGYIRATLTATGPLTQDQIDQIDQIFDGYRRGEAQRMVAFYDATLQGGNPQLLLHSDDPENPAWSSAAEISVTATGIDDPDGGNNAWELFNSSDSLGSRSIFQSYTGQEQVASLLVGLRLAPHDIRGGTQATMLFVGAPGITGHHVSGPGSVSDAGNVSGLTADEWTILRVTSTGPLSGAISVRIYPTSTAAVSGSLQIYRPTLQLGDSDGKLYKSEGTVPAIVTQLNDHSGNGYHQPTNVGQEPIFVADAGDGLPAWWWDGEARTQGVAFPASKLPGHLWTCAQYDAAAQGDATSRYVQHGANTTGNWNLYKNTGDNYISSAGANMTAGAAVFGAFAWTRSNFSEDDSLVLVNGVQETAGGVVSTKALDGIKTGSNNGGNGRMLGYIRATLAMAGPLTAAEIAHWDSYFEQLKFGIQPGSIVPGQSPEEILNPDQMIAYYDSTREGAFDAKQSPQLLLWSDDPTQPEWVKSPNVVVTPGQPDPDGGNYAWEFTKDGTSQRSAAQFLAFDSGTPSLVVAVKAGEVSTCQARMRDDTATADNPLLCTILSGPGTLREVAAHPYPGVNGLSTTEWTYIKFEATNPLVAGNTVRLILYSDKEGSAPGSIFIYRPTLQLGPGDGKQYPSGADVEARVPDWFDLSGNKHDAVQATEANQPIFYYESDGKPSVHFDGVDDALTVASLVASQPIYLFAVGEADPDHGSGRFIAGQSTGNIHIRVKGDGTWVAASGATIQGPAALEVFQRVEVYFFGTKSYLKVDDDAEIAGDGGANNMSTFGVGAATSGLNSWLGPIRLVLLVQGPLAQVQIDALRTYLEGRKP